MFILATSLFEETSRIICITFAGLLRDFAVKRDFVIVFCVDIGCFCARFNFKFRKACLSMYKCVVWGVYCINLIMAKGLRSTCL